MIHEIEISSTKRNELIDITNRISKIIKEKLEGVVTVYVPHTTAGITINENYDPDVKHDILMKLEKLIPEHEGYQHVEGNSDAHIKASLMGSSVNIIVKKGQLLLGTWQGIFFCEFDGPRKRKVLVNFQ